MNDLVFEFDRAPWELAFEKLRKGDHLSAVRFLTLLEGEEEATVEDALLELEEKGITLSVSDLPKNYGTGELEKRLRLEETLVQIGMLLESLEESDPLALYLQEIAGVPASQVSATSMFSESIFSMMGAAFCCSLCRWQEIVGLLRPIAFSSFIATRVSSAATRSTFSSVSRTRGEMSLRLPIGVATT